MGRHQQISLFFPRWFPFCLCGHTTTLLYVCPSKRVLNCSRSISDLKASPPPPLKAPRTLDPRTLRLALIIVLWKTFPSSSRLPRWSPARNTPNKKEHDRDMTPRHKVLLCWVERQEAERVVKQARSQHKTAAAMLEKLKSSSCKGKTEPELQRIPSVFQREEPGIFPNLKAGGRLYSSDHEDFLLPSIAFKKRQSHMRLIFSPHLGSKKICFCFTKLFQMVTSQADREELQKGYLNAGANRTGHKMGWVGGRKLKCKQRKGDA